MNGEAALTWWLQRLDEHRVPHGEIVERDGRLTLQFEDPEGQRLALVDDGGTGDPPAPWDRSPVPAEFQVRGLGPIVISVPTLKPTDTLLTRVYNMRLVRDCPHPDNPGTLVHVFEMGDGGPHAELHVAVQPDLPVASQGAGGVHHVAFRTPDANYDAWADRLNEFDVPNSGKVDRFWFRSLYVREPNGVLFEIATDGPGFAVDEDPATLGEKVVLPPFLERHRNEIIANVNITSSGCNALPQFAAPGLSWQAVTSSITPATRRAITWPSHPTHRSRAEGSRARSRLQRQSSNH